MSDLKMGTAEARFADIIWEREPITSGQMAKIGAEEFNWKKSTSHTVLRRLCERGLFKNEDGTVTSLISREEYYARHSEQYVEETFGGSLPAFLAAFGTRKKLTDQEIDELQKELFEKIKEGDIVEGVVKNVTDFGAFIDLGGADGLLGIRFIGTDSGSLLAQLFA